jgi:acyl carrier protein
MVLQYGNLQLHQDINSFQLLSGGFDMSSVRDEMIDIIRGIFDDDLLQLEDSKSAKDVEGWDSLMHLNIIVALEKNFKIKFATAEISRLSGDGATFGTLVELVQKKVDSKK